MDKVEIENQMAIDQAAETEAVYDAFVAKNPSLDLKSYIPAIISKEAALAYVVANAEDLKGTTDTKRLPELQKLIDVLDVPGVALPDAAVDPLVP